MKHVLPLLIVLLLMPHSMLASETDGTIVTGGNAGYAWSDQAGWVNFGITSGNIHVTDSGVTGYAWSSVYGWIHLNPTNGGVSVAANGQLSGWAWGSHLGWIDFSNARINSVGKFTGSLTGASLGTLTFDCTHCDVRTDYRPKDSRGDVPGPGGGGRGPRTDEGFFPFFIPSFGQPPTGTVPSDETSGATSPDTGLPSQLFDIRLLVEDPRITSITDLIARVTFESFGTEPTPVDLIFTILDAQGTVVWTGTDDITVETEAVLTKRFADLPDLSFLPDGRYILRLETVYNTDVRDIFEQPFTIGQRTGIGLWIWWIVGGLFLLLAGLFLWWWFFLLGRRACKCDEDDMECWRERCKCAVGDYECIEKCKCRCRKKKKEA